MMGNLYNTVLPNTFLFTTQNCELMKFYINNCPTRCNTKQSIYYCASSPNMFRASPTPIIRNTQNCNYSLRYCASISRQRGQALPRWREVDAQKIWPMLGAAVTVLCTPNDRCGWHPKHVAWTCRIINWLFCVASRWIFLNPLTPNDHYVGRTAPLTSKFEI